MHESVYWVAGVDEVGRGPLVGAVVAAAVILDPANPIQGLADSKRLTAKRREVLAAEIRTKALAWALGRAEAEEIDRINILQATFLAMQRALEALPLRPNHVLIDGNRCPPLAYSMQAIVGGDAIEPVISAASIVAKVARDAEMLELDRLYPQYGFAQHKGYPTATHLAALRQYGVLPMYRRTFRPIKTLLYS